MEAPELITHANDTTFKELVEDFSGVTFVDFFAVWCGPCKMMEKPLHALAESMQADTRVKFFAVDVDASTELSMRFNILSIPTYGIFVNGVHDKELSKGLVGVMDTSIIKERIEAGLAKLAPAAKTMDMGDEFVAPTTTENPVSEPKM
jgi:thioredoxin 1